MQQSDEGASFDIVIIGAGLSGIVAAQRLLQVHPETRLTILERDYCLGGVWSSRRIYPSFWSQWTYGIAEFSDMRMERPPEKDCMNDLFRAQYTTKYLEQYADHMQHSGRSLRDRIQFNTTVKSIKKVDGQWHLRCSHTTSGTDKFVRTAKLMVANGHCSVPNMPSLLGKEDFRGRIVHSFDFGTSSVISDDSVQHVTVIGAGKSSADMVYEAVKAGKTVSWIIRKSGNGGHGPAAFAPIDLPTPYKNGVEASQARIMASLQPSVLIPDRSWWTWFLHSTRLGTKLVGRVFDLLDNTVRQNAGYKDRKSDKGFEKLEYDIPIFWLNGTAGACHFSDFWSEVAEKVYVYRASVKRLTKTELYLDDDEGTHFPCDAILCGTGWQEGLEMFENDLLKDLGLPYPKESESPESASKWEKLVGDADEQVLRRFIMLRNPPNYHHVYRDLTPYRLYHTMAPLHDDSILFMNHVVAGAKLFAAEAQAIWAVAYWDKEIKLPSIEERERDVAQWIAWNKRRYLSNGELGNFAAFDSVPYVDKLLDEVGVTSHRGKGWLRNMFAPIMPADLARAFNEYRAMQG
ncbi:putative dimethylaniline monooxygenase [Lophiotrema nucula]|uniref:Putative dimethylaniline monooxygenase n=1 Tax=Lophiotrema nucula TaxID=690887 RepID=A0A6A5ZDI1_9PLEO|nr:putative dimethylaniline monooxygenase [Lophiotrema nucula]